MNNHENSSHLVPNEINTLYKGLKYPGRTSELEGDTSLLSALSLYFITLKQEKHQTPPVTWNSSLISFARYIILTN